MIGLPEIVIVVVILLILFGGYKRLPALGRSAGKGARVGGEKAKELAGMAQKKTEGIDTKSIASKAGKGVREAKELKQVITDPIPDKKPTESPSESKPTSTESKPAN
jgi:TatA/E family protein of Tat protein translocase